MFDMIRHSSYALSLLASLWILNGCTAPQAPPASSLPIVTTDNRPSTYIELGTALYFSTPDGANLLIPAGGYHVQLDTDQRLHLIPHQENRQPLLVASVQVSSDIDVPVPAAALTPEDGNPDRQYLVLALPNKTAWVAGASVSGAQTRGVLKNISKLPSGTLSPGISQLLFPLPTTPQYPAFVDFPLHLFLDPDSRFLSWYRHFYKQGAGVWQGPKDFFQFRTSATFNISPFIGPSKIFSAGQTTVYEVLPDGTLEWRRFTYPAAGDPQITNLQGPKPVGHGWGNFIRVFGGHYDGVIYGIQPNGDLVWYKHYGYMDGLPANVKWAWDGPSKVGIGWNIFTHVFSGCEGTIYGIKPNGDVWWYRHHGYKIGAGLDWKGAWEGPITVSNGWLDVKAVAASCDGHIYVLDSQPKLKWYFHSGYMTGTPGIQYLGELNPPDSFWRIARSNQLIVMQP